MHRVGRSRSRASRKWWKGRKMRRSRSWVDRSVFKANRFDRHYRNRHSVSYEVNQNARRRRLSFCAAITHNSTLALHSSSP